MTPASVFSTVLTMSLTGSFAILAVMFFRLCLKKAPKIFSYALWLVVLFRLLCPVSLVSRFSLIPQSAAPVPEVQQPISQLQYWETPDPQPQPQIQEPVSQDQTPVTVSPARKSVSPMAVLSWIWLLGLTAMSARSVWSFLNLRRKLTEAVRYRGNIYLADDIPTPFVMGLIRPKIYLPSYLDKSERLYIITHERQHIRRCDQIFKFLAYLALSLHWFNPLVWAAFMLSARDMEMSCDEAVIRKLGPEIRAEYSASLLRLATGHRIIAGAPLAFGEGDTKGRVKNMANWKKPGKAIAILSLILCLLVLVSCGMNPRKEPAEPAVPETTETVPQATEPHMIQAPQAETRPRIPELKAQLNSVTQTGASLTLYPEEAGNAEAYFRLYGVDGNLNYALPTLGGEYPASSYSSDGSPIDINVDWKDYWGVLSPGQYILGCHLRLYDKYTSETQIPFTIDRMAIPVPKEQEAARTCYRELFSQLTKNELHYRLRSPEGFTVELWELWDDFMLQTTYDPDYDSSQSPQEFYEDQNFVTCAGFSYIGVHQDPEDYTSPVIGWELYGLETPNPSGITRNEVLNNVFPTQNKPLEFTEGSYITPQEIHFFIGKDTQDPEKEYYEYTYFFDESGKLRKAEAYFHMPWTDGTEYYDEPFTLEFFPETGRQIQDQISSFRKDLKVQTFSWAQDKLIRETESRTVTTSGFTNTRGGHDIETPERAVNQALRELHFMEPIFGGILASYDPEAEMWRITFEHPSKTSQNIGLYERRDVYLDRNGRTVRIHFEDNLTMEDRITN